MRLNLSDWLPKSLFGRMTLILVIGLLAAQFAILYLHLQERASMMRWMAGNMAMSAGRFHPGMPGFEAMPTRFIWHAALTMIAVIAASLVAVRWVTKPLQDLAGAATAFAGDLNVAPLEESGPVEVRRAAEAFNFMQRRLRQLVIERGRALAAVSHDLRTPLTRMRLRAELVDEPALQQKLNADLDAMEAMVNSVLAYLRGLEDTEPVLAIDMEALLHSIAEDERSLGRAVEFIGHKPAETGPAPYAGKLSVLRRAIGNLVDNGLAHGGAVTLRLEDSPAALRILVEDDGPGIPEADLVRVTEPFVRLDAARSMDSGGVGLGLAIVRDAAAYHGGQLVLSNRAEGGLQASLVLPRPRS